MLSVSFRAGFFPTVFWVGFHPSPVGFSEFGHFSLQQISGTWGLLDDQFVNHQDSSLAESSVLVGLQAWARVQHLLCKNYLCCDKANQLWQSNSSCWALVWRPLKRQRLKELTANTHPQMTPPPAQLQAFHEICYAPAGEGGASKGQFSQHTLLPFFLLFWDANFQSLWHRWPVQLPGGAPQLRGGVWQSQFSRQTCFVFFRFLVFWNANFHVFLGGFF